MKKKAAPDVHTHGVMFHHFHSDDHAVGQGSISSEQFSLMLDWLEDRYSILTPDEYATKLVHQKLRATDICLTFDDALLCQSDIAVPIMNKRNLQAFFFVYSSPFIGRPDFLEIFRHFRNTTYTSLKSFYDDFFQTTQNVLQDHYENHHIKYNKLNYLQDFAFYSEDDKWFRYLRDQCLSKEKYEEIMNTLMKAKDFHPESVFSKLWMDNSTVRNLAADGHTIGLHSFSHPTTLHFLDRQVQLEEYTQNYQHISDITGVAPSAMSHPCGNYNDDTLAILGSLGVNIGFRSNMAIKSIRSNLEIPREDHSNIMKEMKNENNSIY